MWDSGQLKKTYRFNSYLSKVINAGWCEMKRNHYLYSEKKYYLGPRSDSWCVTQGWNEAKLNQINIHSPAAALACPCPVCYSGRGTDVIQKQVKNVHNLYK